MPNMVSLRSFLLPTLKGHMIRFEAGVPKDVPDVVVPEAMAAGCVPTNAADVPFYEDAARATVEFQGDARRSTIFLAIKSIVEENDAANFDGGGNPKHEAITERLGYTVARDEAVSIYQQYQTALSEGREFALHPQAQNIMRVIEATSKGELVELGSEFGIDADKSKKLTVRDLRRMLLTKFSGVAAG